MAALHSALAQAAINLMVLYFQARWADHIERQLKITATPIGDMKHSVISLTGWILSGY